MEPIAFQEQRTASALVLAEQERLGRQLHDTLGPQIMAASMLAASLHDRLETKGSEETALAAKLLDRIEQAKVDVRLLGKGFMPVQIDTEGLMVALEGLVEETASTYGVTCRLDCEQAVAVDDNFTATRLFRIAKESVHNAIKHADPNEIVIRLRDDGDQLTLQIRDNGRGFANDSLEAEGDGLRIMRYRAQLIGAVLDIESNEAGGATVTCRITRKESRNG